MSDLKSMIMVKSNPKSMFVRYSDIRRNSETMDDEFVLFNQKENDYIFAFKKHTTGGSYVDNEGVKIIPVVILQIGCFGGTIIAEVVKKEDFSGI